LNPDATDKDRNSVSAPRALLAQEIVLKGNVSDPHGNALPNALLQLIAHNHVLSQSKSGADGRFC
jgi:hypothetical protein